MWKRSRAPGFSAPWNSANWPISIRRLTRLNRLTASLGRGVPLERGLQIDGVALLVQVLADEAIVPDQQACDPSEPVPDDQSLIDVRRHQCEDGCGRAIARRPLASRPSRRRRFRLS